MALLNWYMAAIPLPFGSLGDWSALAIPKDSDCLQDLSKTDNTCTIRKDRDKEQKGIFLEKSRLCRRLARGGGSVERTRPAERRAGGGQAQGCQAMSSPGDDDMAVVESGIAGGMVLAAVRATALLASERARARSAVPADRDRSSSLLRPSPEREMPASCHRAARVEGCASGTGALARSACRSSAEQRRTRGLRLGEGGGDGAAGEDEALRQGVGREPVGAVQAGAGGLSDRIQAGDEWCERSGR